jgi:hypothetical protein
MTRFALAGKLGKPCKPGSLACAFCEDNNPANAVALSAAAPLRRKILRFKKSCVDERFVLEVSN